MNRTIEVQDRAGNTLHALQLPPSLTEDSTRLDHAWYALDYHLAAAWCKGTLTESVDSRDILYRYIEFENPFGYTHLASDHSWILKLDDGFYAFSDDLFQDNYTLKENETV